MYALTRAKKGIDEDVDILKLTSQFFQGCSNYTCENAVFFLETAMMGNNPNQTCDAMMQLANLNKQQKN